MNLAQLLYQKLTPHISLEVEFHGVSIKHDINSFLLIPTKPILNACTFIEPVKEPTIIKALPSYQQLTVVDTDYRRGANLLRFLMEEYMILSNLKKFEFWVTDAKTLCLESDS